MTDIKICKFIAFVSSTKYCDVNQNLLILSKMDIKQIVDYQHNFFPLFFVVVKPHKLINYVKIFIHTHK